MAAEDRLLIGLDACVLIEGIRLRGRAPGHPSVRLLQLFEMKVFRLLLVREAELEARKALHAAGDEASLDRFLLQCEVVPCPSATPAQVAQGEREMLQRLRHINDVPIAIALTNCPDRPAVFLSSNRKHWRPSLREILGGIEVTTVKAFVEHLLR